jgi:radical SAM superfamily enzyme YgiQ (UPF0313 family)
MRVIGISALFTPFYHLRPCTSQLWLAVDPTCPVIMGGAHVNACPEQVLVDPHVDFVVLGEGERTFQELVRARGRQRPAAIAASVGSAIKPGQAGRAGAWRSHRGHDALPLPARDLIDPTRYTLGGKRDHAYHQPGLSVSLHVLLDLSHCWPPISHPLYQRHHQ